MKKKISKILGVVLSLALLSSFFVAAPLSAQPGENGWEGIGLPALAPGTDVGVMAVAPDGTIYAAVETTTELWSEGDGTAEWSDDQAYDGDYSVALTIPDNPDTNEDGAVVWVQMASGITLDMITTLEFWEYITSGYDAAWNVTCSIYLDTNGNGIWDGWDTVQWDTAPTHDDVLYLDFPPGTFTADTWELMDVANDFKGAPASQSALYQPLSYWQLSANYAEGYDATVLAIDLAIGWSANFDNVTMYVDSLSINDMYYDLEAPDLEGVAKVVKSTDGGFTWMDTELTGLDWPITGIAIPANYGDNDETLYVATLIGDIYRLEDAGEGAVILLKPIVDNMGQSLADADFGPGYLYDLEVWNDGQYNWIMAACDLDVMVLKDALFEDWRDQELSNWAGEDDWPAYECAYSPDFVSSTLIWVITRDGVGDYVITSTVSPGQWGWLIDDIWPENQGANTIGASPFCDLAFPDNYTSEMPLLYAALSSPVSEDGNLCMINAAYVPDDSESIPLLTDDFNILSVEVSGDVILAGALNWPTIFRSDDAGADFDLIGWDPDTGEHEGKGPTGLYRSNVYMAPGAFDPDEGVAYVSTMDFGASPGESAISRTSDGGVSYNQVGIIDTTIDSILDLAFSPESASQPGLIATSADAGSVSLWFTADITADDLVYERVLCAVVTASPCIPGNFGGQFDLVEYAQDGSSIMLFGWNDIGDSVIWKSTDGGRTFSHWRTLPSDISWIPDWVVLDGATVFIATDNGFYGTRLIGPALRGLVGEYLTSIALQPGFGSPDTVIVGNSSGDIFVSDDAGATWGDAQPVDTSPDVAGGRIYVAFDADFADNSLIYFAGYDSDSEVGVAEVDGNELDDIAALEDSEEATAGADGGFTGIVVSPGEEADGGNALYAMDYSGVLSRLLLHEDDNLWEEAGTEAWLNNAWGLYFTSGSNILWTIDGNDIWALEDTLAGPITGLEVSNETETTADVEWNAMTGAEDYEVRWDSAYDFTDDTEGTIIDLTNNKAYKVKVRAATQDDANSPWSSRWSALEPFITLETIFAPDNLVPYNGMQDAPLLPSFVWEHYLWSWDEYWFVTDESNAEHYEFQLSTSPTYTAAGFTSGIVEEAIIDAPTNAYTCGTELAYDTNHYWIVRAVSTDSLSGEWAYSNWCFSNFHTRTEEIPPVTVEPAPTPTIILPTPTVTVIPPDVSVTVVPPDITVDIPQPTTIITTVEPQIVMPEEVTPAYIWIIVAIGAVLVIAVIILIIRTRRVV